MYFLRNKLCIFFDIASTSDICYMGIISRGTLILLWFWPLLWHSCYPLFINREITQKPWFIQLQHMLTIPYSWILDAHSIIASRRSRISSVWDLYDEILTFPLKGRSLSLHVLYVCHEGLPKRCLVKTWFSCFFLFFQTKSSS